MFHPLHSIVLGAATLEIRAPENVPVFVIQFVVVVIVFGHGAVERGEQLLEKVR